MGDSLDNQDTSVEAQGAPVVDFNSFANYIRKAATILLPEEDTIPPALNLALEDKNNQECIRKFLSDPQVQALYVQRSCTKGIPIYNKYLICIVKRIENGRVLMVLQRKFTQIFFSLMNVIALALTHTKSIF